jgi:hypothetical protein
VQGGPSTQSKPTIQGRATGFLEAETGCDIYVTQTISAARSMSFSAAVASSALMGNPLLTVPKLSYSPSQWSALAVPSLAPSITLAVAAVTSRRQPP